MGCYNSIFIYIIVSHILEETGCNMVLIMISHLILYLSLTGNVTYVNGN